MSKIKTEYKELRKHGNKEVKVTVVERELPLQKEQIEARLSSLEAKVAALEKILTKAKI